MLARSQSPPTPKVVLKRKRAKVVSRALEFALQAVVDEDHGLVEIVEEVAQAIARIGRQHRAITDRDRLDENPIHEQVEVENLAIHRLQGIVGAVELGAGHGIARRRRASGHRQHQTDQGANLEPLESTRHDFHLSFSRTAQVRNAPLWGAAWLTMRQLNATAFSMLRQFPQRAGHRRCAEATLEP